MLVRPAEDSFRRGIVAIEQGRGVEALAFLEGALTIERQLGVGRPQARYLSYYGLCLGLQTKRLAEGIRCCREALALEFYNADLRFNLGRLLMLAGERGEAYAAFQEGLRLEPGHAGILRELRRMGKRQRLPVGFLARSNPVNVILGRLTYAGKDRGKDGTARRDEAVPSRRVAVR
jgi:tetratricopeptide (TPR) repeat protein